MIPVFGRLDDLLAEPIQTGRIERHPEWRGAHDQMAIVVLNGDQMTSTSDNKALLEKADRLTAAGKRPRGPMSAEDKAWRKKELLDEYLAPVSRCESGRR